MENDEPRDNQEQEFTVGLFIWETLKTIVFVTFFAVIIRTFLIQPFIVEGSSMEPNYTNSDYLIVDRLTYRMRKPERGEVIVFKYPKNTRENYIKRIIGLPGDTVIIDNGKVTIKNIDSPEGTVLNEDYLPNDQTTQSLGKETTFQLTLSEGEYFVLGDNRDASRDSRVFGSVNKNLIVGRSLIRLFPFSHITVFASDDPLTN